MSSVLRACRNIPTSARSLISRPLNVKNAGCRQMSLTSKGADKVDDGNVWKLKNIESTYWNEYIATRPKYDSTIFNPIFKYHTAGSNSFKDALDIGTGSGSALPQLCGRFERVVASDSDPTSLQFAQGRFADISSHQLSYTLSKCEDLVDQLPSSSFDLITCALTFPLLDTDRALNTILTLLRPGGTLAISFYGPPFFTDPSVALECQPLLYALADNQFQPVVSGQGAEGRASWKRAVDGMSSRLDYIPFSQSLWNDVRRHKWNTNARLPFFGPEACDFSIEPVSNVAGHEIATEERDPTFWSVEWNIDMVKRFIGAIFPKPAELDLPDPKRDALFKQLSRAMGGVGSKKSMSWPAVLITARKRS
jgi:SAM-dependent methyltransferase